MTKLLISRGNSMLCEFCGKETDADKVDKSAKSYICGNCVAYLGSRDQEELLRGYLLALEKGYFSKAKAIESFLEVNTDETNNTRRNMGRARFSRKVRSSRNPVRA